MELPHFDAIGGVPRVNDESATNGATHEGLHVCAWQGLKGFGGVGTASSMQGMGVGDGGHDSLRFEREPSRKSAI